MAVVVEGEVQPLFVRADEAVGVVDAALWTVTTFLVQDLLVRPRLHAVEADPEGQRAPMLRVGIVQQRDRVAAERIQRRLASGVGNLCRAGILGPSAFSVFGMSDEEDSAETIRADEHGDVIRIPKISTTAHFRSRVRLKAVLVTPRSGERGYKVRG